MSRVIGPAFIGGLVGLACCIAGFVIAGLPGEIVGLCVGVVLFVFVGLFMGARG